MKKLFKFSLAKWLRDCDRNKIARDPIQGLRIMERRGELYLFVDGEAVVPLSIIDMSMRDKLDAILGQCRQTRMLYRVDAIYGHA